MNWILRYIKHTFTVVTDTEEDQLREQFAVCGDIENVRIVRDRRFRLGKGFGYILFKVGGLYIVKKLRAAPLP